MEAYKFPVELQNLFTKDGKESTRKAVVRLDTNQIIGDVSNKYKLVTHDHVFGKVQDYMSQFGHYEENYSVERDGARVVGSFLFKHIVGDVKVNDNVGMKVVASASYDGKSSIGLQVMGLRLKCLNGMAVGEKWTSAHYRHSSTHITDTGELKVFNLPKHEDVIMNFHKDLQRFAILSKIEADNKKMLEMHRFLIEANIVPDRFIENAPQIEEPTYWGIYNQATEYLTHTVKTQLSTSVRRMTKLNEFFFELPEVKRVG
jgi:hypothetical protein